MAEVGRDYGLGKTTDERQGGWNTLFNEDLPPMLSISSGRRSILFSNRAVIGLRRPSITSSNATRLPERHELWPQCGVLHHQWPGSGEAGDPYFDQFDASTCSRPRMTRVMVEDPDAVAAAANYSIRIWWSGGARPTHSPALAGWQNADARPDAGAS